MNQPLAHAYITLLRWDKNCPQFFCHETLVSSSPLRGDSAKRTMHLRPNSSLGNIFFFFVVTVQSVLEMSDPFVGVRGGPTVGPPGSDSRTQGSDCRTHSRTPESDCRTLGSDRHTQVPRYPGPGPGTGTQEQEKSRERATTAPHDKHKSVQSRGAFMH